MNRRQRRANASVRRKQMKKGLKKANKKYFAEQDTREIKPIEIKTLEIEKTGESKNE